MKRLMCYLGIFFLIGAIINVAVAWSLAIFAPLPVAGGGSSLRVDSDTPSWYASKFKVRGGLLVYAKANSTFKPAVPRPPVPPWSLASSPRSDADAEVERTIMESAYGWPMVTLYWRKNERFVPLTEGGMTIPWFSKYKTRTLPLAPIWPDTIVNTIVFSMLMAVLFTGFRALGFRRRWRIRHGRCQACGYPVGVNDVCTECGKPVVHIEPVA